VDRVGCPDPQCVSTSMEVEEEEVARVVTSEEVERLRWLRKKRAIEKDPSMLHCPLSFCQAPVPKPQGGVEDGSGWSRLRTCQACGYSFCAFCKRTWWVCLLDITLRPSLTLPRHGPLSGCPISVTESLVSEYVSLEGDSPKRVLIERRYGKANMLRLVAKYEEDRSNAEWFKSSTMACPGCHVSVEKSAGCNHVSPLLIR
jgi:E3 ubiquitin-protein ligase RNF14